MNDIMTRTPELIATEINIIKEQTKNIVLHNSIEIGRKLVEAKELVSHGEWGNWLEQRVEYSQRTANNLMKIYEEYGTGENTLLNNNSNSQAIANLNYTQAVLLLGVSKEERESFIEDNDIENMSTRELKQAIQERDLAIKKQEEFENKLKEAEKKAENNNNLYKKVSESYNRLEITNKGHYEKTQKLNDDIDKLNKKIKELENKPIEIHKGATNEDIEKVKAETKEEYEKQLAILKIEKDKYEKMAKELELKNSQQSNAAALKYSVFFDETVKNFKELLGSLNEIKDTDIEAYERFRKAFKGLLDKMYENV